MRGTVLYGSRYVRFEDGKDPASRSPLTPSFGFDLD
jgi:hypothetical protein